MNEKLDTSPILGRGIRIVLIAAGLGAVAIIIFSSYREKPSASFLSALNSPQSAEALLSGATGGASASAKFGSEALPKQVMLRAPFSSQSPLGDWSQPYQDACEETSVLMAMAWIRGEESIAPEKAQKEILGQVAFENFNFGYHGDTAIRETAKIFANYYNYKNVRAVYGIAIDDIRRELAAGNLVIVPAAGTILNNPHYASPPPYHMAVITGYDDIAEEFIVNDPGTKHGAGWRYSYETISSAVHDWTGSKSTVLDGRKGMIVVHPPGR